MTTPESPKILSLGSVIGGRTQENRHWPDAILDLTKQIALRRARFTSDLKVNIEFYVPGNLFRPEFEGIRTGTFRKRDSLIKVQVALPEAAPANARTLLVDRILSALDEVDVWTARRQLPFSTTNLRLLMGEISGQDA